MNLHAYRLDETFKDELLAISIASHEIDFATLPELKDHRPSEFTIWNQGTVVNYQVAFQDNCYSSQICEFMKTNYPEID